jgi:hypothetical protein
LTWLDTSLRFPVLSVLSAAAVTLGCSIEATAPVDEEDGSTHAVVRIERSESADGTPARAEALAGFVHVPPLVDPVNAMSLVGLGLSLPDVGECSVGSPDATSVPLSETARVEFLPAGDVTLEIGTTRDKLAPNAFPTVTDSISGVLYTSRNRDASLLPTGVLYTVTADELPIAASERAPEALDAVTAGGVPLPEVTRLKHDAPLDLTWSVGAPNDLVYVAVTTGDTARRTICSFADDVGAGTVPLTEIQPGEVGRVVMHRLRSRDFEFVSDRKNHGELRFDFALTSAVQFY